MSALVRGCRSPQQLPSKVYAQGFLISSLRAAVRAAVFTTAAGKLSTNLEGSICCPGGPKDGLIERGDTAFSTGGAPCLVLLADRERKKMAGSLIETSIRRKIIRRLGRTENTTRKKPDVLT